MGILKEIPAGDSFLILQTRRIIRSYRQILGRDLWPSEREPEALVKEIFHAPFVLCSAGAEADPILNYANAQALSLWEMNWDEFTRTPGRLTAQAPERQAREHFLKTVREQGFIDNYCGIRISKTGRLFEIRGASVWNVLDEEGSYAGQAASFSEWKEL